MDQRGEMVWASLDFPHPAVCEEFHFGGPKLGPIPNFRWEAQLLPQCYSGPNLPRADRTRPGIDKSEESASPASRKAFSESPLRDTAKSHHGSGPPSPSCALLPPLLLLLSECLASNKRRRAHPHRGILHGQGNLSIRLDLDLFISFLFPSEVSRENCHRVVWAVGISSIRLQIDTLSTFYAVKMIFTPLMMPQFNKMRDSFPFSFFFFFGVDK